MTYLVFDSNIWIYLLDNSWTESNPLDYLEHWLGEKQVKILVPEIIIKEWNKHKEEEKEERIKTLRNFFGMAKEIIPSGFIQEHNKPEYLSQIVDDQFRRIENIINLLCEIISIEQAVQLKAVQWGVDRKAPMHNKSSMADTLIVLSLFEFATNHPTDEFYFISNNVDDFFERQNKKTELHTDLKNDFEQRNIKVFRQLDHLIYELKKKLPVLINIESSKKDRLKAKLEQQIYNPALSDLLKDTKDSYLDNINFLDLILTNETPTKQQIMFALDLIESGDSYAYYFYKNNKKLVWFQFLVDRGTFQPHHNPTPVKIDKGYNIPGWWPMMYLLTIAGDPAFSGDPVRCKQVTDILEEISKHPRDNNRTWYFIILIIEKLPNNYVPESLLDYIPVWLAGELDNSMISSQLCKELLNKFYPEHSTADDYEKAKLIIRHLFALKKDNTPNRSNPKPGHYYSPVYQYYLSGVPLDEDVIKNIIAGGGESIIIYISENLKKLLHDYPEGITTTIHDATRHYEVKAIIEEKDVVIYSREKDTDGVFRTTRLTKFLELEETAFDKAFINILAEQGISYRPKENKDYNLEIIRIGLLHGKSYSMDSVPIHKLEASDEHEDDLLSLFTLMLTKLLIEYFRQIPSNASYLIKKLWDEYRLPLFKRLLIYVIGQNWSIGRELFTQIITDDKWFFSKHDYEKEIYWLLKQNTGSYTQEERELLKTIIERGPDDVSDADNRAYIERWKLKWYSALKTDPEFGPMYQILSEKLNTTAEQFENMGEVSVRVGSVSPLSTEEILEKSNEEIFNFILNFKPADRWAEPNVDGMAERLGKAVEKEPNRFASEIHLYKNAYYIYIYYLLNGFREAWKNKLIFDWYKVLVFCKDYIDQTKFRTEELKLSTDSWNADDEWIAGAIATLLSAGMQSDEQAFDPALLPTAKDILSNLAAGLNLPSEVSRKNLDYPTYSLNSTAGKVLRALFDYSLRRARLFFKAEDADKWEPDMKGLFEQSLQKGLIDGYILQGMYFEQFYFLDKDWIMEQIKTNLTIEESKWLAFISGLIFGRAPGTKQIYLAMYPHYEKAIQNHIEFSTVNEGTMVRHLASFYFWDYEKLEDHKLVYQFLQESPAETVREFIGFVSRQEAYYKSLEGEAKTEFEEKIMTLWKTTAEKYKNATTEEDKKTLSSLASLLSLTSTLSDEITQLVLLSAKGMTEYYHWHGMMEDLIAFSEKGKDTETARRIGQILLAASNLPLHTDYEADKLKMLVTYLFENVQKEAAIEICDAISRQGHTFLRDTYKKYRNME